MTQPLRELTGRLFRELDAEERQRKQWIRETLKGTRALLVYGNVRQGYGSKPYVKPLFAMDGVVYPSSRGLPLSDVVLDTTGTTARALEVIRKERRALNLKEQRLLKRAMRTFAQCKKPDLEVHQ